MPTSSRSRERGLQMTIIGAGAVGSVIARLLTRERNVASVTCVDRDIRRAREQRELSALSARRHASGRTACTE